MKKIGICIAVVLFLSKTYVFGQSVTIDPSSSKSIFEAKSDTKGILIPQVTTTQKLAITNPTEGLLVYDTEAKQFSYCLNIPAGPLPGINCIWVNFGNVQQSTGWVLDGNTVKNTNAGNIGVGVPFPTKAKFEVGTSATTTAVFGSTGAGISLQQNVPTIGFNQYRDANNVQRYISDGYAMGNFVSTANGNMYWNANPIGLAGNATASETPIMTLTNDGKFGIGTDPLTKFHVQNGTSGTAPFGQAAIESNEDTYLNLMTPSANQSGILFGSPLSNTRGGIVYTHNNGGGYESLALRTGGNLNRMIVDNMGNVAIGNYMPSTKLDVDGAIKAKQLIMPINVIVAANNLNYNISNTDFTVVIDAGSTISATMSVTLPNPQTNIGRVINLTIANYQNVASLIVNLKDYQSNSTGIQLTAMIGNYFTRVALQSSGTTWIIIP